MVRAPRVTLVQSFVAALAIVALLLGVLAAVVLQGSKRSILESAEKLRAAAAQRVEAQVRAQLDGASAAVAAMERDIQLGVVQPTDERGVEQALFREAQRNPNLAEISFIHAVRTGFDGNGDATLAPGGRWQISVFRSGERVSTRRIRDRRAELRARAPGAPFDLGEFLPEGPALDPTKHLTFMTTASRGVAGAAIWTDLAWSQLDEMLPKAKRRVVVSVQKAMMDGRGAFVGVARAALLESAIADLPSLHLDAGDPHRIFVADADGRLITRLSPDDRLELVGDELRMAPARIPPPIALALQGPLKDEEQGVERSGEVMVGGERWLATFRALEGSQDWFVGVVVPERAYTRELHAVRVRLLCACAAIIGLVLLGGGAALLALRRGLGRIHGSARRMRELEFSPGEAKTPFRDVHEVLGSLEQAKTALRGMGKYAPLDLVRELYAANREPALGGELRDLSILFTDLEGFTSLAERMPPDELARALGLYFDAMTAAIRGCGGTVDKFIGDAVMALWNAPTPREGHARLACDAILACREATARLYRSPAWRGLPPLRTRFGLHRDRVMVGHFGAPERFSYTALGDGVNLASRLEGLCKQYEVDAVVSAPAMMAAGAELSFRRLDRVAVKGRSEPMSVYELLGGPKSASAIAYESALDLYFRRDFAAAIALLQRQPEDGPSRVLLRRCHELIAQPPPSHWNGVHVAATK